MVRSQRFVPVSETVDPRDVRAFCQAVDLGSITAAAAASGETKGSVSRRVARLEAALGTALLRRVGRRVEPTDEGVLYRQRAGAALDQLDEAARELRDRHADPAGHLRVTAPIGLGTQLLGPFLGRFVERFPRVTVEVVLTDAVLSFQEHRIDLAVRISDGLPDSSLVATRLFDVEGELADAPAYVAAHGAPARPEDLDGHRLIVVPRRGPTMPIELEREGERVRMTLRGHVASHDLVLLREAALGGAGIALLPKPMVALDVAAGRLVRVLPEWRVASAGKVWLLHAGGVVTPKVRAFRDELMDSVRGGATGCPG
jgi:DNA-binding transcriptional LysR family regulator